MKTLKLKIEDLEFEVPVFEKDGINWVALHPLCNALGISSQSQSRRARNNNMIRVCHMEHPTTGGNQSMLCIDIDSVGEWIFGINPRKVRPEIRERMYLFRRKLQAVLYASVTGHADIDLINTLVEEIKKLRIENEEIRERLKNRDEEIRERLKSQDEVMNYLMTQQVLGERYIDKQLASVGGKLLSNVSRKRKLTTPL